MGSKIMIEIKWINLDIEGIYRDNSIGPDFFAARIVSILI
jgi:hypothetical protein